MQMREQLRFGNRITKQHMEWKSQKMKVKLAVQVLSASTAKAIEFLRLSGVPEFSDSQATEKLIVILDRLFDILNSRSIYGKGYKKPIMEKNLRGISTFLRETTDFLMSLEDCNGTKIHETKRRTCVLGMCATIQSIEYIIEKFLVHEEGVNGVKLKYLRTYKFSQDHIELMFGLIRRRGGWNNNPTSKQFSFAYRSILSHIGVIASNSGNVIPLDSTELLTIETHSQNSDHLSGEDIVDDQVLVEHSYAARLPSLNILVSNVCAYIAGFVIRKILFKNPVF